jgi:hypothetical protein
MGPRNIRVTNKTYGVSVSFCHKLAIFKKNRRTAPTDFDRKFENFENPLKFIYRTIMDN